MVTPTTDPVRPLRLAHLTTVDMSLALLLATELATDVAAGHEVIGISTPGPYVERVTALGVRHVAIPELTRSWSPTSDLRAFESLVRTLKGLDLDVVHTHNPKTGVMGRIAGRLAGVPVVVNTCHGLWARPEDPLGKRLFVYGLEALAIRFSDYEFFQNAADAHTLRRVLKPGLWRVVGNGVDLERFVPDAEGRRRVRAEWGVADDELVVGTIGRRVREKGLAEFAEAAHRLRGRATFVWVGPTDDTDAAADVPHADAVRFVGERSDMPAVYSALDVFALASYREGFSRASMEAAACGRPLVLTDIRGCREVGTDGEHLLLVPVRDGAALASGVARMLDDPALRERLGANARERAASAFDQRAVAAISLQTYAEVARRKGLGARGGDGPAAGGGERLTVVHVLPADQERGAQAYAGRLRDALADDPEQRHLVVTLFAAPDAAARPDVTLGVRPGRLRVLGLDPRAAWRLRGALRANHADVVVAHGGEALKYVTLAAGRIPSVYYKVGLSAAELSRPSRVALYRALSRRVDRVVAISDAVARQVREVLGVPPGKMSVIPNGRDPEVFRPREPDAAARSVPLVLFVGALEPGKRPGLFVDIVAELRRRGLVFDAAIVGDGPLRPSLAARAADAKVRLVGVRDDVPELLREAAVLVMTSAPDSEGMPGVLIEAGLSGVPVVATDAAGVRDIVVDGETGFVAASDSVGELADAVTRLLVDPALRWRLGESARQRCTGSFTVAATADPWKALAASLHNRGGTR